VIDAIWCIPNKTKQLKRTLWYSHNYRCMSWK